tara:strand:- start:626 stop:1450 length:825 start_codon:yes stop_codon:yes gene_type:complete
MATTITGFSSWLDASGNRDLSTGAIMSAIPVAGNWVRLKEIHPLMKKRLEAFFADPRIKEKIVVSSGCRTYSSQKELFRKYKAGTFPNVVADPDRKHGPGGKFQGSFHMAMPNAPEGLRGYAYAVDFRIVGKISTSQVNKIAAEFGLVRTVPSEWWHHQAYGNLGGGKYGWYKPTSTTYKDDAKLKKAATIEPPAQPPASSMPLVKRGSRGAHVKVLQTKLSKLGFRVSKNPKYSGIDGIAGSMTIAALKRFQKSRSLTVDGLCGKNTWKALGL